MHRPVLRWWPSLLGAALACGDASGAPDRPETPPPQTQNPSAPPEPTTACDVPSDPDALLAYLRRGDYRSLAAESGLHDSTGPHGGRVLTYVNDLLAVSLDAGNTEHPRCAASIKELFGTGDEPHGWAVLVKTETESERGRGYYWLEVTRRDATTVDYAGQGLNVCVGCHSTGRDFFLTPWPLQ